MTRSGQHSNHEIKGGCSYYWEEMKRLYIVYEIAKLQGDERYPIPLKKSMRAYQDYKDNGGVKAWPYRESLTI